VKIEIPGDVPWIFHRIAVSGFYHDGLDTILTRWSLEAVGHAHDVIDALEDARARAAKER
jgi:hypothetical protein